MESEQYGTMRALEDTHWWYRALRAAVLERIGKAESILDVGCGTGGMLALLGGRRAVGIDLSGTALSLARGRGIGRLARGSACVLPFRSGTFDAVLLLDVVSHKAVEDDLLALAECARVARPGGTVVVHVRAYRVLSGRHDLAVHGARRYTRRRIGEIVRRAGLEVVELTYRNLVPLPFAAVLRLGSRARRTEVRGAPRSDLRPLPPALNRAMGLAARAENAAIRRLALPAGLSVLCLARKRAGRGAAA